MGEHTCAPPSEAWPGDEWTCPKCGKEWWADMTDDEEDAGTFHWDEAPR
jgi:hypothetical protein